MQPVSTLSCGLYTWKYKVWWSIESQHYMVWEDSKDYVALRLCPGGSFRSGNLETVQDGRLKRNFFHSQGQRCVRWPDTHTSGVAMLLACGLWWWRFTLSAQYDVREATQAMERHMYHGRIDPVLVGRSVQRSGKSDSRHNAFRSWN
jgi:hypothetical protein